MNKSIKDYEKHFLLNALNVIKYFCRVDSEKASELIVVFSSLLNYMIFNERKYVSILEELELVSYMKSIQQIRFNNEVILVKEETKDIEIPKGIILYMLLLGYNLNILRINKARIEIRVKNKVIEIKMISDLSLSTKDIKENEFFQKAYQSIINLDCKLDLCVNDRELSFAIFL